MGETENTGADPQPGAGAADQEHHISSVLLRVQPEALERVAARVGLIEGAEVHMTSPEGKMVVSLETDTLAAVTQATDTMTAMSGVVHAALVYHHAGLANEMDIPLGDQRDDMTR